MKNLAYKMPAEWAHHDSVWLAWPADQELWGDDLLGVRREAANLYRAIAAYDSETRKFEGEEIKILFRSPVELENARKIIGNTPFTPFIADYGDIWLRDTGPIFVSDSSDKISATVFKFNGWGNKYLFPEDLNLGMSIAVNSRLPLRNGSFVLEGGSIDVDGEGLALTTKQCLLNPNRNSGFTAQQIEGLLSEFLGVESLCWIEEGLANDHTDGHIDTLARFVAPGVVLCMEPRSDDDPNARVLNKIATELAAFNEGALKVHRIPSPGRVHSKDGILLPASYANFYIGNKVVVVPTYGSPFDDEAVDLISRLFPGRQTIGSSARAILEGGGAFHCITQQQPSGKMASS